MFRKGVLLISVLTLLLCMIPSASAAEVSPFVDISKEDPFYSAALWAYSYGILEDQETEHFEPERVCTREQVVSFLWRMAGRPEPVSDQVPFSDVSGSAFSRIAIWAAEAGIACGYPDGTFRPQEVCSRQHAMTFLWRYLGKPESTKTENPFSDVKENCYTEAILWSWGAGIIRGYEDGCFRPEQACNRAEIVSCLYRTQHPESTALPTLWKVNCEQYVVLWNHDYGGSYDRMIGNGETVQLLGWTGDYAHVQYQEYTGYVCAVFLQPEKYPDLSAWLSLLEPVEKYSYESMMQDLQTIQQQRPWLVTLDNIGFSEFGKEIPVIRIGNENAEYHILLQGAIHGREHMTAWLLTAMAEYWTTYGIEDHGDVCYHIIPMANPDGVYISQSGTLSEEQLQIYYRDYYGGATKEKVAAYAARWKANGMGVDLNRNFPAGWKWITSRSKPSSERHKGESPFCAAESLALRDYTLCYEFDATISYHASGSLIYYEYSADREANLRCKKLAKAIESVSGYPLQDSDGIAGAGYKDWVLEELGITSVTIETGIMDAPLELREIYSIFARNLYVMPAVADWLNASNG